MRSGNSYVKPDIPSVCIVLVENIYDVVCVFSSNSCLVHTVAFIDIHNKAFYYVYAARSLTETLRMRHSRCASTQIKAQC